MNKSSLSFFAIIAVALMLGSTVNAQTNQESLSQIKSSLKPLLGNDTDRVIGIINATTGGNASLIDAFSLTADANGTSQFSISLFGNATFIPIIVNGTVVNGTIPIPEPPKCNESEVWNGTQCVPNLPPQPKIEICGDGIDNDDDGLADEGCPISPPEQSDEPAKTFNQSQLIRLAVVGDIDNNNGLTTQINLAHEYNANCFVVAGDFGYHNGQEVIDEINNADFDCVVIDCGNHDDDCDLAKQGHVEYRAPLVSFFLINAGNDNVDFDSASEQFAQLQDQLGSSDSYYNIPIVHQPFVTVASTHSGNGEFKTYDPLFRANGVENVLQAHNHNYQRINVNGIIYGTYGTGTHDMGSDMYPLKSNDWQGHECQSCITGTNGITIMDLKIDDPSQRLVSAWFISNSDVVKDKWVN